MINYETILSTFDDKLTLMQWLQKVEQALEGAGLESVEIHQQTPTTAYFKFVFADGTSVTTPSITLPRGPKGDTGATGATGATGNGIASISKTGSSGLVDVYTILYTNGSTQIFSVTNGAKGADGADGVGIDDVEIIASTGVLKVTLTDETEINAGNVYNVVTIDLSDGYSGTLSANDLALVKLANTVIIDNNAKAYKYDKERVISVSETLLRYSNLGVDDNSILTLAYFDIDKDTGAWSWNEGSPYVDAINSGSATNGQVLTADGSGGASWQNASGGSFDHYIEINWGYTGTLTQAEYDKLTYPDSCIYVIDGTTKYKLGLYTNTGTSLVFLRAQVNQSAPQDSIRVQVNQSTKAVSFTQYYGKIDERNIGSGSTTNGQVLTADGNGGASWANVSSGKYQHNITAYHSVGGISIVYKLINTTPTAYTTMSTCRAATYAVYGDNYTQATGHGSYDVGGVEKVGTVESFKCSSSSNTWWFGGLVLENGTYYIANRTSGWTINDVVLAL